MEIQECNLKIRYDLPKEVLDKLEQVYSKMPGWFGKEAKDGIPYWFGHNENEKHIFLLP